MSHSGAVVRTISRILSGHSVIDHASDRCTPKTGYSQVDDTKLSVKDRFRKTRSGTADPNRTLLGNSVYGV